MFKLFTRAQYLSLCAIAFVVLLSGCNILPGTGNTPADSPADSPAAEMLPDLPGYNTVEGQLLTDYISSLSEGASLLAGQPELAATALAVDQIISCYQEIGAVQSRVYSNKEMPLSVGTVAIADRNMLTDPINLFKCVLPTVLDASGAEGFEIKPCSASYTLSRDDNEFYIIYAGSTEEICRDFCSHLEGCTAH